MKKTHLVDLEMILVFRKGGGVLLQLVDEERNVWLPTSQIEIEPADAEATDKVTVTMPEWLAINKELV